jgi:uncharacterized protein YjbJ (UPF0337 family)
MASTCCLRFDSVDTKPERSSRMGITDKVSGRVKQAAGDLLGDEGIRRQGADEERKGEAKQELAREEDRADHAQANADRAAAQREYDRADADVEREQARAEHERTRADERADEVASLERRT